MDGVKVRCGWEMRKNGVERTCVVPTRDAYHSYSSLRRMI